jgi:hypothetical protein
VITLGLLAGTAALLLAGQEAWRPLFALAHLGALIALAPLGVMLLRYAVTEVERADAGPLLPALVRAYPTVVFLLAAMSVTIVISLLNFEDGIRWLRRIANFSTVGIVLALVARYLMWTRDPQPPVVPPPRTRGWARRSGARRR